MTTAEATKLRSQVMQNLFSIVLAASLCGLTTAEQPKEDKAKADAAKAQLTVLDTAVQAYFLKHATLPDNLKALVDDNFVEAKSLIDPWGKEYQYEVDGKHNDKKKP